MDVSAANVAEMYHYTLPGQLRRCATSEWWGWSDGTWFCWWKRRLAERGFFQGTGLGQPAINLPVTLHVFFVRLGESPEQLARLKNERPAGAAKVARRRLSPSQMRKCYPIDRVANQVLKKESP